MRELSQLIAIWGKSLTKPLNSPLFASSQLQMLAEVEGKCVEAGRKGSEKSTCEIHIC